MQLSETEARCGQTTRLLEINDIELCVATHGDPADPLILLIGGINSPMDWWRPELCRQLAAGGRFVVRYDHRDTGQSTTVAPRTASYGFDELVADAAGLIDVLADGPAHVVGISMGGGIAQRLALDHAGTLATQTLMSTTPGLRPGARPDRDLPPMAPELMAHFTAPSAGPDFGDRGAVVEALVAGQRQLAGAAAFDEELTRSLASAIVARTTDLEAAQTNHGLMDPGEPYRERLNEITVPTLIMHGTADPLFPFEHAEALAREIPGAKLIVLDGVGHEVPPQRVCDRVTEAILRHTW